MAEYTGLVLLRPGIGPKVMEAPKLSADPSMVTAPTGAIGTVRLDASVPAYEHDLAHALFANQDLIWTSMQRIHPDMAEKPMPAIDVKWHLGKGKSLFEATCRFADGQEKTLVFTVNTRREADLAATYRRVCLSDPEHTFAHRWGAETEIPVRGTSYQVFSTDFHPGATVNEVAITLEAVAGTPGYPNLSREKSPLRSMERKRLEELLARLVGEFKILGDDDRRGILEAREENDVNRLAAFEIKLRKLLLKLDQEAVKAQALFWLKTNYYQDDPRRNNVVFRVNEEGRWTFKMIDYESMYQSRYIAHLISAYDIFNHMQHKMTMPGSDTTFTVTDATVRPWVWTYQEDETTRFDRSTFFEVLWEVLPNETRGNILRAAMQTLMHMPGSNGSIASSLHKFLAEQGVIEPLKTTFIKAYPV